MPVATKFESEGVDNGFSFCPAKVNVNDLFGFGEIADKWTTLSGWSKVSTPVDDAAKAQSIADSLTQAMKLFWNLNGFDGSYHKEGTLQPTEDVAFTLDMDAGDYESTQWNKTIGGFDTDVNKVPKERVCYNRFEADDIAVGGGDFGTIWLEIDIVRMYDGVTTDEDNFVGYGSGGILGIETDNFEFFDLHSWYEEPFGITEYVEFSGAHYVANLEASQPDGTLNANYSIAVDVESGDLVGTYTEGAPVTYTLEMTIEPLDFYTYPA